MVLCTLPVDGAEATLGRSARGRLPPAGSPTFFEESRRKEHQGSALDPGFIAARSHSLVLGIVVFGTFEGLFPPVC